MHHAGGMGQFQGYGQSQQWPPSEYPPAYYGYNQAMFGHHLSFNNANMHGNFGGQKTFNRSESLPVDHQNGGGYTGSYPYSPSPSSYWTDTSSGRLMFILSDYLVCVYLFLKRFDILLIIYISISISENYLMSGNK